MKTVDLHLAEPGLVPSSLTRVVDARKGIQMKP